MSVFEETFLGPSPAFPASVPLEYVRDLTLVRTNFCSLNSPLKKKKKKGKEGKLYYFAWLIAVLERWLQLTKLA